jgi:glycerophosphoryl diester phosphodiesterase
MRGTDLSGKTALIAHRGASRDAPENTLAAFRLAWQQGADGVEADFRLTGDGRLVCLHDPTTGRTAGIDLTVAETRWEELAQLEVGGWKDARWHGERIPLLEEVLEELPPGKMLFIELKGGADAIPPLERVLAGSGAATGALRLLTFDSGLVPVLKAALPGLRVCLNVAPPRLSAGRERARDSILELLAQCGADGLSSRATPLLDAPFVSGLRRSGREVLVWTVDSVPAADRYRALGIDGIMTNRPGWLRSRLTALTGGLG